ncbi:MAG TPA: TatD family hydrolase [Patescibacteria group bacterium]|jgi:TatD DNase family protein|nr:TatD family hydrolase [Patescibacteria group bacterium]
MFFDSHTHVNFHAFKDEESEIIAAALRDNVWMVNVGTQYDTSKSAMEMAEKFKQGVYAAIGLHPVHTYQQMLDEEESHFKSREEEFDARAYAKLLTEKVVAVGECGLDFFRLPEDNRQAAIKLQKDSFVAQINFAKEHKLALIVHCRDAYDEVLEILQAEYRGGPGVIHSYTGDWATAKKFLDFGFYVAFNGILTFDKTGRLAEVCKQAPLDRILVETDAPYLTPPPFRGKRNQPLYVQYVAAKVAEVRNISLKEAADATFSNACTLFKINPVAR